jgi:hypothetical protein
MVNFFPEVGPFWNLEHQLFRLHFNIHTDAASKSVKNIKSLKIHQETQDLYPINFIFALISYQMCFQSPFFSQATWWCSMFGLPNMAR